MLRSAKPNIRVRIPSQPFLLEPVAQLVERTPDEGKVDSSTLSRFIETKSFFIKKKKSNKAKDKNNTQTCPKLGTKNKMSKTKKEKKKYFFFLENKIKKI